MIIFSVLKIKSCLRKSRTVRYWAGNKRDPPREAAAASNYVLR